MKKNKIEQNNKNFEENIKRLRNNLLCMKEKDKSNTVLITSPNRKDGKSFISSSLAIEFVKSNKKTLLIDYDMDHGKLDKIFKISNDSGLNEILKANDISNYKNYIKPTKEPNLYILNRGKLYDNTPELLTSDNFSKLLNLLKQEFDVIILDGSSINEKSEMIVASKIVDQVVIVCRIDNTNFKDLKIAEKSLKNIGVNITGLVINEIPNR